MPEANRYLLLGIFFSVSLLVSPDINDSTLLKVATLYIGSLLLVSFSLSHALRSREFSLFVSPFQRIFAVYIFVCGLSLFMALNRRLGLEYILQLACFLVVLTTSLQLPEKNRDVNRSIARSAAAVSLISCLVALFQIIPDARFGIFPVSMVREAVSTFGNRAYFAGFLVLALPIVLSRAANSEATRGERFFFFATALVALFFIIQTESRSAWMATLAALFLFAWLNYRTAKPRFIMLALVLLAGGSGFLFFPELIHRRLENIFEMSSSSSVYRRFFFYEGAWNAFRASPLLGHGLGNFSIVLPKYRSPDYWMAHSEDIVPHAHNEILEILSETGLAGFICVALMVIIFIRTIRAKFQSSSGNQRAILVGYVCALFAVCIDNLTDMTLRTAPVAFFFWMVVGLALRGTTTPTGALTLRLPHWVRNLWLLPTLIVLPIVWMYVQTLVSRYIAEEAFLQGIILRTANNVTESTKKLATTLEHDPSNGVARLYAASNLAQEKRYTEARDHIAILLDEYPYYPKARIVLATTLFELGDTVTAMQTIRDELAIETSPQATYVAAYLAHRSGNTSNEAGYLQTLLANAVRSEEGVYVPEALRGLSQLCAGEQIRENCENLAHRVAEKFWKEVKIVSAAGGFFADVGSFEEAKMMLQHARTLDPRSEEIGRNLHFVEEELARRRTKTLEHR